MSKHSIYLAEEKRAADHMDCKATSSNRIVAVGGTSGVGKSTVLRQLQEQRSDIECRFLSKELNKYSLSQTGKDFATNEQKMRDHLRSAFTSQLLSSFQASGRIILLDCHYTDVTEDFDKIIQPKELLEQLHTLVLFDAQADVIMSRRLRDKSRSRLLDITSITRERESEKAAVIKIAAEFHLPWHHLMVDIETEHAVQNLLHVLEPV